MSTEHQFDGMRRGRGRRGGFGPGGRRFGLQPGEFDPRAAEGDPRLGGLDPRAPGFDPRAAGLDPRLAGRGRRERGRAGRGDVRAAVLLLLAEQPMHGYQIIQELSDRTGGMWKPSPGAVYPALSLLEDEGLVIITSDSGRKLASLTEAGQAYIEREGDRLWAPWLSDRYRSAAAHRVLAEEMRNLTFAARQAMQAGGEEIAGRVAEAIANARRAIYAILSEPPAPAAPTAPAAPPSAPATDSETTVDSSPPAPSTD